MIEALLLIPMVVANKGGGGGAPKVKMVKSRVRRMLEIVESCCNVFSQCANVFGSIFRSVSGLIYRISLIIRSFISWSRPPYLLQPWVPPVSCP